MSEKICLVDGSGYIFRAYYAVAPLTTKDGFPTNALFGYTRMLLKLLEEIGTDRIVVVFDAGKTTFRNEMYPEYKANRDECPEDLKEQMPYFREISKALGLTILEEPGYEADDLIGTIARRMEAECKETVIVSADKDLTQLVTVNTTIWDTMRDKWYDEKGVKDKFGVVPDKIVEFLGLTGDASDNIPGLKGVGPKTAVQLIEKYGDVATIIESAAEIAEDKSIRNRKKIAGEIELNGELLRLSRKLVEINCESPVRLHSDGKDLELSSLNSEELIGAFTRGEPSAELLTELIEKLEFSSLLGELPSVEPSTAGEIEYRTVFKADFEQWLAELDRQECFSFDLETTSLDVLKAEIVGFAFCWQDDLAWYIPVAHKNQSSEGGQLELKTVLDALRPILTSELVTKIAHNAKYDSGVLAENGLEVSGPLVDTMIQAYLISPDRSRYTLSALALDKLKLKASEYKDVVGDLEDFSHVEIADATVYAAEDAAYTWLLAQKQSPEVEEGGLQEVAESIEMPLINVLSRMERTGVLIDTDFLRKMSEELEGRINQEKTRLFEEAGCEFNLNSPKQLSELLFDKLEIPTKGLKKTKTGISTDSSVLEKLSNDYELPRMILRYRSLHKLKSTYVDTLPEQVSEVSGRLHSKFNQAVTGTGRLSSSDPNLQNIPISTDDGRRIRKAFIAGENKSLISADYSQVELRVLAHMSDDQELIRAFNNDEDIHSATARDILGLGDMFDVSAADRRIGKTINFGVVYGMSGFRLGKELGIPVGVATNYINSYFEKYNGVRDFFDGLEEQAETDGFVTTMFGRKRILSEIETRGRDKRFIKRVAINAPIQGTAADIIKLAMIAADRRCREEELPMRMILQIHDELLFECDSAFVDQAMEIIQDIMSSVVDLKVPLKVDISHGENWEEAH